MGEFFSERGGEDFKGGFSEKFLLGLSAAATGEGFVDYDVAGVGVFDEVDGIGNAIEEFAGQMRLGELVKERVMGFRWRQGGEESEGNLDGGKVFCPKRHS